MVKHWKMVALGFFSPLAPKMLKGFSTKEPIAFPVDEMAPPTALKAPDTNPKGLKLAVYTVGAYSVTAAKPGSLCPAGAGKLAPVRMIGAWKLEIILG